MRQSILLCLLLHTLFVFTLYSHEVEETYRNPVIPGDIPDPTIIRVDNEYFATGTTSDFAPNYPLYHSIDLINWERIGNIFTETPSWIMGDCWAPELFYHNDTFYVYYTARKKENAVSCIGVATTKDITQGFEDHGILIEWGNEAIDAYIFRDDDEKLYISWKAYGLDPERKIEILCSELTPDGLALTGEHFTLTDHIKGWSGRGDEGQCIVKHNDHYYLLYSVGGCCDRRCDYQVYTARARDLRGPWEQNNTVPLLTGGEVWKCSGHGTLVQTPDNRYFYLYHAYHSYDFEFVGRQGLLDELMWDESTGWPYFRYGNNPTSQAPVPFKGTIQKRENEFYDNFTQDKLSMYWQWDMKLPQLIITRQNGKLTLQNTQTGKNFLGFSPATGNWTTETSVLRKGKTSNGLCIYGNKSNFIFWGVNEDSLHLISCENGNEEILFSYIPEKSEVFFLKIESFAGRLYRFFWSTNGKDWSFYPENENRISGFYLPQWGKGVRIGLMIDTCNEEKSEFNYFRLQNKF